jgi:hypothetical protein
MMFPEHIERAAFRSPKGQGEYAWRYDTILDVIDFITAHNHAILGGEVWYVRDERITGLLPRKGGGTVVCTWDVTKTMNETWAEYVARSQRESSEIVRTKRPEEIVEMSTDASLYYNLSWVDENKFAELFGKRAV